MYHIRTLGSVDDSWTLLLRDDPVRPEIEAEHRIHDNAEVLILVSEQDEPVAVVCVRYCSDVPRHVEGLLSDTGGSVAVFYSIWSYSAGAGSRLIAQARAYIESTRPGVTKFVTLSPPTDMARRFHIKNGASLFRENTSSINYEYP